VDCAVYLQLKPFLITTLSMCIYFKTDDLKLMICFIYDKNPAVDSAAGFT